MGQVYLKDKDGLTQGFTIKGDKPSPTEMDRIQTALAGPAAAPPAPPQDNTGIMSALGSGIGSGFYQTKAGIAGLAGLAANNISGDGTIAGYDADQLGDIRDQAKQDSQGFYAPKGLLEDQQGVYGKSRYLAYQFGQSLPSTVGGTIGAIAGSAVGPEGTVAGFLAGSGAAGAASVPQNYEQNLEEQEQANGKITNPGKAFKGALAQSALEGLADRATLGVAGIAGKAVPTAAKSMIASATRNAYAKAAAKVGESTLMGMSTEAATEAVQQGIQRWQADEPLGGAEAQQEYLENAIVGGLLGGIMGGSFGAVGAGLDAHEQNRVSGIRQDLDAEASQYGNAASNVKQFGAAQERRAAGSLAAEDNLQGPHQPLLEDLRQDEQAPLLSGPKVVTKPVSGSSPGLDTEGGVAPSAPSEQAPNAGPTPAKGPVSSSFSEQEYADTVAAMAKEKLVSPDKIKTNMKIGRTKATAIFNAMLTRNDARTSGMEGKYLTVVQNATSGKVNETTEANPSITRTYEARPVADEEKAPFNIRRAKDTKTIGPDFKTSEEAFGFADQHNLSDFSVIQNDTPKGHGVYEVTSGVPGQGPVRRLVKTFATSEEAQTHANGLNPQLSPETNEIQKQSTGNQRVMDRINEQMGKYQSNVQNMVDGLVGPGHTFVDLVRSINTPDGRGIETGNVIEGMVDPSVASGVRRMTLAAGIHDPSLSPDQFQNVINSVAHHEVVHVARAAGIFSPSQWNSLVNRAHQFVPGKKYSYVERAQVRSEDAPEGAGLHEEAVAEMVRDYMRDPTKFKQDTRSLLRRFMDFVGTFGRAAKHIADGNAVLDDFGSGKLAKSAQENIDHAKGPFYSSVKIPGFYLKSEQYFENLAKDRPDLSYPGTQWLGNLKNQSIKQDELDWLGLKDWLSGQKKVSVGDILQFIGANSVDVQERTFDTQYDETQAAAVNQSLRELRDRRQRAATRAERDDLDEQINRINDDRDARRGAQTFHHGVVQKGGEDYKEMVFHIPSLEPVFSMDAHFGGAPNVLAHGRFNTRTIDGKKTLFIEEIQSDLHQQGKKKGYTTTDQQRRLADLRNEWRETKGQYKDLMLQYAGVDWPDIPIHDQQNLADLQRQQRMLGDQLEEDERQVTQIPEAPFKSNWSDFVIKRLIRHAAETGHDAISWNAEAEGVAATEQYGDLFNEPNEQGDNQYYTVSEQNVTGIVNFYTKRLAQNISKLFGKAEFGNPSPKIIPRVDGDQADLNMEELFPTKDDFHMVMQEVGSASPDLLNATKRARQIAIQQRTFNAQEAMEKAGLPLGRFKDVFNELFPEYALEGTSSNTVDQHGNLNVARWQMDITPELKAKATGEGFSMFSSVNINKTAPDTPEFRKWFGGSKVVGDDGKPITVYHGTTQDFDQFDPAKAEMQNDMGAGFYFTSNEGEMTSNYAHPFGSDRVVKMVRDTELLGKDARVGPDGIDVSVAKSYAGEGPVVIPSYLSIRNPLVLSDKPGKATTFDRHDIPNIIDAANAVAPKFENVDTDKMRQFLTTSMSDNPTSANEMMQWLKRMPATADAIDPESGMDARSEVARSIMKEMGYDGIIDDTVARRFKNVPGMQEGTTHYVAFEPNQIKAVDNTGAFDSDDNRFMYSSLKPSYSAVGTFGGRVPAQPPRDTLSRIEGQFQYNVIAPRMEKLLRLVGGKIGIDQHKAQSIAEGTIYNLQDKNIGIAKLIDRVRANGGTISDASDTYLREQLMTGKAEAAILRTGKTIVDPLINNVQKLNVTQADVNEILAKHPSMMVSINGVPQEQSAVRNILGNYSKSPKMAMAELYLYAQHAMERNAVMRDRNDAVQGARPNQYDAGSGMTDAEARDVLQWLGSKQFNGELSDLSNPNSVRSIYRRLIKDTNDARVAGGLNPDFRQMVDKNGDPVDKYQDYAPLRGWVESNPDHLDDDISKTFANIGKKFKIMGKEDRNATGRGSQAANLIANAILQNQEAHVRAEKNLVGQSFVKMLKDNQSVTLTNGPRMAPNTMDDFAEVSPLVASRPVYDKATGKVRMAATSMKNEPDMLVVKFNGGEVGVKIHDPRIRAAMLGDTMLGSTGQGALVKALLNVNRVLAAVRTSFNPEFLVSNFFRDMGHAQVNLSEYGMGLHKSVLKDTPAAIRGVYRGLRDTKANDPWRHTFEDFEAHGGKTAFMGSRDLGTQIDRITKELQTDPQGKAEKIKHVIGQIGHLIEHQNDAVENGVRVATYKNLVDRFLADSSKPNDPAEIERAKNRAAFAAKNLTVNFNMGGAQKPLLNALYLFYNASLQGSVSMINPMIRSKTVRRAWMAAVAGGALQDIIMSTLSPMGDDGQKEYDKISDQVLQTNMIFMNPLSDSGYIKIPMPYLFNAAWNSGRALTRGMRGGYTPGQAASNVFGTLAESLNPWGGGGSWLNYVAPTILDPMVDLTANVNFMGAPIAPPPDQFGKGDIPSQRYWNNTSPAYKSIASWMDYLTGGDGVFKGAASYSPNQYEYAFEYLGGGAWSTALRAWDFVSPSALGGAGRGYDLLAGNEVSANDVPIFRRFLGNLTSREDLQGYIAKRDRVLTVLDKLHDAQRNGDSDVYQSIMEKYPDEYKVAVRVNGFENQRRKIGSQIKKITANARMSDEEKTKLVGPLKQKQKDLVNKANLFMNTQ